MNLCSCGCGEEVIQKYSWYVPKFILGHYTKLNPPSKRPGVEKKISDSKKGRTKENDEGRRISGEKSSIRMKNGGAVHAVSFVTKEGRRSQAAKIRGRTKETHKGVRKQSEYMKNGGSVYTSSFITNPSRPQVETWKNTCKVCPYVYLNFPVTHLENTYSIDIAIPKLEIAIEYDGFWWHQDREKDLQRQKELEKDGWKFIRYVDKVPTREQVKEDIQKLVENMIS